MPRPVEIEFLSDGAEPHPDDDVLQLGRPRRFPRWAWIVAIAALAGLIATAIVSRPSSPGGPTATDVPSGPILPPPLRLPSFEAFDAAVSGGRTWVLRDGRITVTDEHGTRRAVSFGIDMSDGNSEARLLVDPPGGLLWVVVEDVRGGQVIEFDATRLTELRSMRLPSIAAAAPLDGRLYVISEGRLVEISRTATPRVRAGLARGRFFALAADPTRNRLLVTDAGAPTHVWSYRPDGTVDAVSQPLALGKGSLAVAAGRVWVGGYSSNGAVLERIVPGRTRPSPLAAQLGPGAWVVAAGERVVWVRSGSGRDDLWCVDAATGRAVQHWNVAGQVASAKGRAIVASGSGALELPLSGCAG